VNNAGRRTGELAKAIEKRKGIRFRPGSPASPRLPRHEGGITQWTYAREAGRPAVGMGQTVEICRARSPSGEADPAGIDGECRGTYRSLSPIWKSMSRAVKSATRRNSTRPRAGKAEW
jgi:hypothetical protein